MFLPPAPFVSLAAGYKSEIEITPAPDVEVTTKKSGWFGGFKKFFGSSSSETTTTPAPTSSVAAPAATTPRSVAAAAPPAQKPPPLVISHAPLMPLGPRPDTPSSSPFGGSSGSGATAPGLHGPQWPVAGGTAAAGTGAAAGGAQQPSLPVPAGAAGAAHHPPVFPTPATSTQHTRPGTAGASTAPNLPPGFAPYRPQKAQPSPFDLSYGGGGAAGSGHNAHHPGFGLAPLTSSTTTTSTTPRSITQPGGVDLRFGGSGSGSGSTTSTVVPQQPHQPSPTKEAFPTLPVPRRPSQKEDYPPLPTPRSPAAGTPSTPTSPSAWQSPLPTPVQPVKPALPVVPTPTPTPASSSSSTTHHQGHHGAGGHSGVSFVPHAAGSTTTVRPGFQSTGNSVATDDEIRQLTEQLYTKETNNQLSHINVNLQGRTRSIDSADEAPQP